MIVIIKSNFPSLSLSIQPPNSSIHLFSVPLVGCVIVCTRVHQFTRTSHKTGTCVRPTHTQRFKLRAYAATDLRYKASVNCVFAVSTRITCRSNTAKNYIYASLLTCQRVHTQVHTFNWFCTATT